MPDSLKLCDKRVQELLSQKKRNGSSAKRSDLFGGTMESNIRIRVPESDEPGRRPSIYNEANFARIGGPPKREESEGDESSDDDLFKRNKRIRRR